MGAGELLGSSPMKAVKKVVAWPTVFATFLVGFAYVTYIAAQPLAVAVERATWYVGLASRYRAAPTYSVTVCSWILVTLLTVALVRWLGRRSIGKAVAD
jgi:hypothetical protein